MTDRLQGRRYSDEYRSQGQCGPDAEHEHPTLVLAGTANVAEMITKTKRLSTDRLVSTRYPAKYWLPYPHPHSARTRLKTAATAI